MAKFKTELLLKEAVNAYSAGKVKDARRLLKAILKSQPKHADANHNMGILVVGLGKPEEALPFFKKALEAKPSVAQFWYSYIDILIRLGKLTDAKAVLKQAQIKGAKGGAFDVLEQQLTASQPELSMDQCPPVEQLQHLLNLHKE